MRKIKSNRTCDNFIFSSDLNSGDLESKQKEWFQKKCRSSEVVLHLKFQIDPPATSALTTSSKRTKKFENRFTGSKVIARARQALICAKIARFRPQIGTVAKWHRPKPSSDYFQPAPNPNCSKTAPSEALFRQRYAGLLIGQSILLIFLDQKRFGVARFTLLTLLSTPPVLTELRRTSEDFSSVLPVPPRPVTRQD